MKNMKKLLGAMAALGFTTVAAVNVVACSKPAAASNDLTKSFNSSYTSTIADPNALKAIGLVAKGTGTYTFKFGGITDAGIQSIITKTSGTIPVNNGVTVADPSTLTATNQNDEIAQVVAKTGDGDIVVSGDQSTVQYMVTLKLWKADSTKKYIDQQTSMDVTVNINTVVVKINLSGLAATATVGSVTQGDVPGFTTSLKSVLAGQSGFEAIKNDNAVTIKKGDNTDLAASDIVTNSALSIIVMASGSVNFNDGQTTISVNLTTTAAKKDLSGLPDTTSVTSVVAGDVSDFTTKLKTVLATGDYAAISSDSKVTVTRSDTTPLQGSDIATGTLNVLVIAKDSVNFNDGQKAIAVSITTA